MRWRNIQMFGWKEIKATLIIIFLIVLALLITATGYLYSDKSDSIEQQQTIGVSEEEQAPKQLEENINQTPEKQEPEIPEDNDIYEVNTFFFSSECVFRYDKGIDDTKDLKSFIAKTEGRIEVAGNSSNETGIDYLYEQLEDAKQRLSDKTLEIRELIQECRSE